MKQLLQGYYENEFQKLGKALHINKIACYWILIFYFCQINSLNFTQKIINNIGSNDQITSLFISTLRFCMIFPTFQYLQAQETFLYISLSIHSLFFLLILLSIILRTRNKIMQKYLRLILCLYNFLFYLPSMDVSFNYLLHVYPFNLKLISSINLFMTLAIHFICSISSRTGYIFYNDYILQIKPPSLRGELQSLLMIAQVIFLQYQGLDNYLFLMNLMICLTLISQLIKGVPLIHPEVQIVYYQLVVFTINLTIYCVLCFYTTISTKVNLGYMILINAAFSVNIGKIAYLIFVKFISRFKSYSQRKLFSIKNFAFSLNHLPYELRYLFLIIQKESPYYDFYYANLFFENHKQSCRESECRCKHVEEITSEDEFQQTEQQEQSMVFGLNQQQKEQTKQIVQKQDTMQMTQTLIDLRSNLKGNKQNERTNIIQGQREIFIQEYILKKLEDRVQKKKESSFEYQMLLISYLYMNLFKLPLAYYKGHEILQKKKEDLSFIKKAILIYTLNSIKSACFKEQLKIKTSQNVPLLDTNLPLEFESQLEDICQQVKGYLNQVICFLQSICETSLNPAKIYQDGVKLLKEKKNIKYKILELVNLNPNNPLLVRNINIYIKFIETSQRSISSLIRIRKRRNVQKIEKELLRDDAMIIELSLDSSRLGDIKRITKNFIDLLEYENPSQLIGQNIGIIIPHKIAKNHSQYIEKYLNADRQVNLNFRNKALFGVDKYGFIFPFFATIKLNYYQNEMNVSSFCYNNEVQSQYILYDEDGTIQNVSKILYSKYLNKIFNTSHSQFCMLNKDSPPLQIYKLFPSLFSSCIFDPSNPMSSVDRFDFLDDDQAIDNYQEEQKDSPRIIVNENPILEKIDSSKQLSQSRKMVVSAHFKKISNAYKKRTMFITQLQSELKGSKLSSKSILSQRTTQSQQLTLASEQGQEEEQESIQEQKQIIGSHQIIMILPKNRKFSEIFFESKIVRSIDKSNINNVNEKYRVLRFFADYMNFINQIREDNIQMMEARIDLFKIGQLNGIQLYCLKKLANRSQILKIINKVHVQQCEQLKQEIQTQFDINFSEYPHILGQQGKNNANKYQTQNSNSLNESVDDTSIYQSSRNSIKNQQQFLNEYIQTYRGPKNQQETDYFINTKTSIQDQSEKYQKKNKCFNFKKDSTVNVTARSQKGQAKNVNYQISNCNSTASNSENAEQIFFEMQFRKNFPSILNNLNIVGKCSLLFYFISALIFLIFMMVQINQMYDQIDTTIFFGNGNSSFQQISLASTFNAIQQSYCTTSNVDLLCNISTENLLSFLFAEQKTQLQVFYSQSSLPSTILDILLDENISASIYVGYLLSQSIQPTQFIVQNISFLELLSELQQNLLNYLTTNGSEQGQLLEAFLNSNYIQFIQTYQQLMDEQKRINTSFQSQKSDTYFIIFIINVSVIVILVLCIIPIHIQLMKRKRFIIGMLSTFSNTELETQIEIIKSLRNEICQLETQKKNQQKSNEDHNNISFDNMIEAFPTISQIQNMSSTSKHESKLKQFIRDRLVPTMKVINYMAKEDQQSMYSSRRSSLQKSLHQNKKQSPKKQISIKDTPQRKQFGVKQVQGIVAISTKIIVGLIICLLIAMVYPAVSLYTSSKLTELSQIYSTTITYFFTIENYSYSMFELSLLLFKQNANIDSFQFSQSYQTYLAETTVNYSKSVGQTTYIDLVNQISSFGQISQYVTGFFQNNICQYTQNSLCLTISQGILQKGFTVSFKQFYLLLNSIQDTNSIGLLNMEDGANTLYNIYEARLIVSDAVQNIINLIYDSFLKDMTIATVTQSIIFTGCIMISLIFTFNLWNKYMNDLKEQLSNSKNILSLLPYSMLLNNKYITSYYLKSNKSNFW